MVSFKQFCESREQYLEQNPAKGFYELNDTIVPIYTRNYKFFIHDEKKNDMIEVTADKIVHQITKDNIGKIEIDLDTTLNEIIPTSK